MSERIAFLHPGALGDLILALPVVQSLAGQGGRVELFASAGRAEFLAGRSAVAAARSIDDASLARLFADDCGGQPPACLAGAGRIVNGLPDQRFERNLRRLLPAARVERLDVRPAAVERAGVHASVFLHRQLFGADAAAPMPIVNPNSAERQAGAKRLSAAVEPPPNPTIPRTPTMPRTPTELGIPTIPRTPTELGIPTVPRTPTVARTPTIPRTPTILIHPGGGSAAKCWPIECFVALAGLLASGGRRVAFVLGEAERDRGTADALDQCLLSYDSKTVVEGGIEADRARVSSPAGSFLPVGGRWPVFADLTLPELAGLIAAADVYLGNDSGPTHLAAAIGRPTVALFGPTDPAVWAPRGASVRVVRGDPSRPGWAIAPAALAEEIK